MNEAFAEEKPTLLLLPLIPFGAVLKLDRRISCEGMVSVGGNYYSVPDATRRRVVEVHSMADKIKIFEVDRLIYLPSSFRRAPTAVHACRPSAIHQAQRSGSDTACFGRQPCPVATTRHR